MRHPASRVVHLTSPVIEERKTFGRPVDDALAAAFMADFYETWLTKPSAHLAKGLALAKDAWAESTDQNCNEPHIWAPFVLVENTT